MKEYQYDKQTCVEAVRRFIEKHQSTDAKLYESLRLRPTTITIAAHVGSWNEAVRLAGGIPKKNRTSEEILESFRRTIANYGRLPPFTEYSKNNLNPTPKTLKNHGFSYDQAVQLIGLPYHFKRGYPPHGRKICPMCGVLFEAKGSKRIYCTPNCRDRFKQWKYRTLREMDQKCPQCGGEMDYPVSRQRNKKFPKYCSRCQSYYKRRHRMKNTPPE